MQAAILFSFAAILACVCAQVYVLPGHDKDEYPPFYKFPQAGRGPGDMSWGRNIGGGRVFGSLNPNELSGMGGYKGNFFDDARGQLQGTAYGSRSLLEDRSKLGGKLDWTNANRNFRAGLDVNKEIGGISGMKATADGVWKLDKDTRLVAGGFVTKDFGGRGPDGGIEAKIEKDF